MTTIGPESQRFAGASHGRAHRAEKVSTGTASFEALLGGGALVLGILGLVGILPGLLAAIAIIALGASMLMDTGSLAARYKRAATYYHPQGRSTSVIGGGVSVELLGGLGTTALGVLALLNIAPLTLLSVAVLVFGACLLLGAGANAELESLASQPHTTDERDERVAHEAVQSSSGARVLVGIGAGVLGILALTDVGPAMTLILVAIVASGATTLLNGIALGSRMASLLR